MECSQVHVTGQKQPESKDAGGGETARGFVHMNLQESEVVMSVSMGEVVRCVVTLSNDCVVFYTSED